MPQATWRNKTFGVSDKQAEAAKDLGFSFSWNQDTKALDIIPVSFSVNLLASMGANIEQEIADYKALAGKTGVLKIGGKQMLPTMQLVGCDVKVNAQAPSGKILDATLSLSFEEYNQAKREKATKSAATSSGGNVVKAGATPDQKTNLTEKQTAGVKNNTTTQPYGPQPYQKPKYWIKEGRYWNVVDKDGNPIKGTIVEKNKISKAERAVPYEIVEQRDVFAKVKIYGKENAYPKWLEFVDLTPFEPVDVTGG